MPIHDVGYRKWDGEKTSQLSRWQVISQTGIRLATKSAWVRRILLAAWLPVMFMGIGFFALENRLAAEKKQGALSSLASEAEIFDPIKAEDLVKLQDELLPDEIKGKLPPGAAELIAEQAAEKLNENAKKAQGKLAEAADIVDRELAKAQDKKRGKERRRGEFKDTPGVNSGEEMFWQATEERFSILPHAKPVIAAVKTGDEHQIRKVLWRWMLMMFFRYPQSLMILFLIGLVAPSLISRDLRSRAFLMYFSRPIGKLEYIFGKLCIPAVFIAAVTTLPALALYLFAIMMSPSLNVFWSTWDIPLRIIAATFALVIPTSALALMLSSLTHESRFANFSWFAVWALGHGAWVAIVFATAIGMRRDPFHADVMQSSQVQNWSVLSLYNCLGDVQEWIFGFESFGNIWRGAAAISVITIFSLFMLYRRVSAPTRV